MPADTIRQQEFRVPPALQLLGLDRTESLCHGMQEQEMAPVFWTAGRPLARHVLCAYDSLTSLNIILIGEVLYLRAH